MFDLKWSPREKKAAHAIDPALCTRCRLCQDVCPADAIQIVR